MLETIAYPLAGFALALALGATCLRLARRRRPGSGWLRWLGVALAGAVAVAMSWNGGALLATLVVAVWAGFQQACASELPHPE
ncbi:hypothetical protein [Coralloluteibacterium stylophorae]|uniref:Uncharacterized protein n=1 Tax=Coralloluteibacterium stylophorae TaxID=1776034 RepID=A0A8J7VSU6_9GAMM|nr:hypothetical protein [Coralloluteibacterium stylophorae]MBS7456952.1 hypothetical protein [Coralloluteibacterium stylophorae]